MSNGSVMTTFILEAETFSCCKSHHFHPRHIGGTLFCQQDEEAEHKQNIIYKFKYVNKIICNYNFTPNLVSDTLV